MTAVLPADALPTGPARVLCVDDNIDLTTALEAMIASNPALQCAGCINSAWNLTADVCAIAPPPHVMILDATMPGLDLFVTLRELVRLVPSVRIIIYSGHDDAVFKARAHAAGVFACVSKGDEPASLFRSVCEAANSARGNTAGPGFGTGDASGL